MVQRPDDDASLMGDYFWFYCGNYAASLMLFSGYAIVEDGVKLLTPTRLLGLVVGSFTIFCLFGWGNYHVAGRTLAKICDRLNRPWLFCVGASIFVLAGLLGYVLTIYLTQVINLEFPVGVTVVFGCFFLTGPLLLFLFARAIAHWPMRRELN